MDRPGCEWCDAPADLLDNYDTLRCWDCWDDGGRDKPHNLIFRVLRDRDGVEATGATANRADG